jgi:signal transduction histidine kinase
MEVRDNGEGLPEGFSLAQSSGVGLAGMRERMKQLGGSLEVVSSPYGVCVKCRLGGTFSAEDALLGDGREKEDFVAGS